MSNLWTPPGVSADPRLRDRTDRFNADVMQKSRVDSVCEMFNRELRQIDPRLEMRWFGDVPGTAGVVPNRYALVRTPEVGPRTVICLHGPNGEFMEPTSALFAKLAEGDMWSTEANRERRRREEGAARARERQEARETEERHDELEERWKAVSRTSVSMNRDTPWAQNWRGTQRRSPRR